MALDYEFTNASNGSKSAAIIRINDPEGTIEALSNDFTRVVA
jgi:hypothetical protein